MQKTKQMSGACTISKRLRDIIHGYVMSDGFINEKGILQVEQSQKQKKFVFWLYDQFKAIVAPGGIRFETRKHRKTEKQSLSVRFFTKSVLHGFHKMWYIPYKDKQGIQRYKKKLPDSIHCFFSPLFITVWFAGDGTKMIDSVGAKFEVTCFRVEERLLLKNLFLKQYNLKTNIIKSGTSKKGNIQ